MPALLHAQRDDSKYLAGAVPEADGKVVFTKDFSIPGMSQDTIYSRLLKWMDTRLAKNENTSRVVYSDREKGQIVGMGDEWIVFSSTALSLDRTKILYQLTLTCQPEKCTLEVEKIRFSYREGKEKYTAEEWITDKYALNKSKTKLVRGLAKWRRKTVDFVDDLCVDITEALSASTAAKAPAVEKKEEKKAETALVNSGTTVITPQNAGYGGNSQNICNSGCRHRISLRRIQGSVSGCHPLGCNPDRKRQIGNRNRRRTFQYDNDDGQCRRFIRQNSREQSGGIHHPVARPALRTNGCGTELHRTFLS